MNKTRGYFSYLMGLLLCFCASQVIAEETSVRRYQLPDHGSIQLNVPTSWKDELRQPPNRLPPTIVFKPSSGPAFGVLMTPIWPAKEGIPSASAEAIRQQVQQAAEHARSQAVEKTLEVLELKGLSGLGYYFSATDRAPKPGEYKYMTQGILKVSGLTVTFTILTNEGQDQVVQEALAMMKTAVHVQP